MRNENNSLLLYHARLVSPERMIEDAALLVEEGKIARIYTDSEHIKEMLASSSDAQLDLEGALLMPGLIDIHIHGSVGVDTMEATADDLRRVAEFLASNGVTGWLPTLVPAPDADYQQAVAAIDKSMNDENKSDACARPLGVHYEGPFINSAQCGALRTEFFLDYASGSEISRLARLRTQGAVHLITVAPEIAGGRELIEELCRAGWIVSIGHTRAEIHSLEEAFAAGARHMTHFMNAMSPLHHRAPGPVGWGLTNDGMSCDMIADGHHLDPLILRLILRCKTAERTLLISDAVAPAGLGDGDYKIWGETIKVEGGRTQNERGSIAGSVISMLDAVRMMFSLGIEPVTVARLGATNPARLLGKSHECGSIEEGKRADLFALDENGNVKLTLVGGMKAKLI